jgi:hypothetical protein
MHRSSKALDKNSQHGLETNTRGVRARLRGRLRYTDPLRRPRWRNGNLK